MAQNRELALASSARIEAALGQRVEQLRLAANQTQTALAGEAGVSRRTITRLENGGGVSLDTFIRVLRALGMHERLLQLLPDPQKQPVERLKGLKKPRQRARGTATSTQDASRWAWGDDEPS